MAKVPANVERSGFGKGLITEVSPFNFPDDASIAEENFILLNDNTRRRRYGIDYEKTFVKKATSFTSTTLADKKAFATFRWDVVGGDPTKNFLVIQINNKLWFVDLEQESLSSSFKNSGNAVTISSFDGTKVVQADQIAGDLIITTGNQDITVLSYNASTDVVTRTVHRIKIRDFFGVDDGLTIDNRPTSLSNSHNYNLLNQGWTSTNYSSFKTSQGVYPSNADVMYLGKDATDVFDPAELVKQYFGNTPAAQGHYIIDAFTRGSSRQTESGVTGLATDSSSGGLSCVAVFAGRVFYSGSTSEVTGSDANSPKYSNYVFFSQVVEKLVDAFRCYPEADPTSEHVSDLIDSDGGYLSIPGATEILKLIPIYNSLLVVAKNGIWQILGGDAGFSALAFQVQKAADLEIENAESIVVTDGGVFVWATAGIYLLTPDPTSGILVPENISEPTIQKFFNAIPYYARRYARGLYDETAREVRWIYNDDSAVLLTAPEPDPNAPTFNQYARPVNDITVGGFGSTPLWSQLDEDIRNDTDYIQSSAMTNVSGSTTINTPDGPETIYVEGDSDSCQVKLTSMIDPLSSTGHIVRYTIGKNSTGGRGITTTITLKQGATTIANWVHSNIAAGFVLYEQTLTAGQANAITDYTNLSLQISCSAAGGTSGTRYLQVSWVEMQVGPPSQDDVTFDPASFPYRAQKELVFHLPTKGFYPVRYSALASNSPFIVSFFTTIGLTTEGDRAGTTKYLVLIPDLTDCKFTFAFAKNTSFKDWYSENSVGVDAPAFMVGGYITGRDTQRTKGVPYLTIHCERTETGFTDDGSGNFSPKTPSSCQVQSQWEWTNDPISLRWSSAFEAYRYPRPYFPVDANDTFNTGFTIITTRNRIRGHGKAVTFKFSTKPGHDLHLLGWAMVLEGQSVV